MSTSIRPRCAFDTSLEASDRRGVSWPSATARTRREPGRDLQRRLGLGDGVALGIADWDADGVTAYARLGLGDGVAREAVGLGVGGQTGPLDPANGRR